MKLEKILELEGLSDWKITKCYGGGALTYFDKKEIRLSDRKDFGLFLHELAHAVSGKKHYENDGILMDTMTKLVRKYTIKK